MCESVQYWILLDLLSQLTCYFGFICHSYIIRQHYNETEHSSKTAISNFLNCRVLMCVFFALQISLLIANTFAKILDSIEYGIKG